MGRGRSEKCQKVSLVSYPLSQFLQMLFPSKVLKSYFPLAPMIILVKLMVGVNDLFVDEKMKIIGWGETEPGREDINLKYGDVVGFSNEVTHLPRNARPF